MSTKEQENKEQQEPPKIEPNKSAPPQPRIYQDEINTWPKWLRMNLRLFMEQHFDWPMDTQEKD